MESSLYNGSGLSAWIKERKDVGHNPTQNEIDMWLTNERCLCLDIEYEEQEYIRDYETRNKIFSQSCDLIKNLLSGDSGQNDAKNLQIGDSSCKTSSRENKELTIIKEFHVIKIHMSGFIVSIWFSFDNIELSIVNESNDLVNWKKIGYPKGVSNITDVQSLIKELVRLRRFHLPVNHMSIAKRRRMRRNQLKVLS